MLDSRWKLSLLVGSLLAMSALPACGETSESSVDWEDAPDEIEPLADGEFQKARSIVTGTIFSEGQTLATNLTVSEAKTGKIKGRKEALILPWNPIGGPIHHPSGFRDPLVLRTVGDSATATIHLGDYGILIEQLEVIDSSPLTYSVKFSGEVKSMKEKFEGPLEKVDMIFTWLPDGTAFGSMVLRGTTVAGQIIQIPCTYEITYSGQPEIELPATFKSDVILDKFDSVTGHYSGTLFEHD